MNRKNEVQILISEIESELGKLDELYSGLQKQISRKLNRERVESMALRLHNIYTGFERIFQIIAHDLNGKTPDAYDWHRQLLSQMSLDLPDIRPAVIAQSNLAYMRDMLAFRHVVRYAYGFELIPSKVKKLAKETIQNYPKVKKDFYLFLEFLKALNDRVP